MASLADKLKSLGVKTANTLAPQPTGKSASQSIDSILRGDIVSTSLGETFVAEEIYGEEYLHGKVRAYSKFPLSLISQWAMMNGLINFPFPNLHF
ncbi:MAG: hypothetical protein HC797_02745 [Anaerolineales bacterium]|nr:hypothetical protein [Anaerolineales bacterium]